MNASMNRSAVDSELSDQASVLVYSTWIRDVNLTCIRKKTAMIAVSKSTNATKAVTCLSVHSGSFGGLLSVHQLSTGCVAWLGRRTIQVKKVTGHMCQWNSPKA